LTTDQSLVEKFFKLMEFFIASNSLPPPKKPVDICVPVTIIPDNVFTLTEQTIFEYTVS
jgi:hypothetical protein